MTEKDARIARTVMVDELNTINKYEAMADNADSEKVRDVVKDIAREEKVHTGEGAALLDKADPEAKPAMLEGVKEVRSFKESDQTYFSPYTGKLQAKPPKVGDAGEPHHTRWEDMSDEQKKRTDPERYERERRKRMKKSVGPTFAEMFADERSKVLAKTGMMTDEALEGFRKSMFEKAGDFSVYTVGGGVKWPNPGEVEEDEDRGIGPGAHGKNSLKRITTGDMANSDVEVMHPEFDHVVSPQQSIIARNNQPKGREGKTPEQSHDERLETHKDKAENKRIELENKSGEHELTPVEPESLAQQNDKMRQEQPESFEYEDPQRTRVTSRGHGTPYTVQDTKYGRFADDIQSEAKVREYEELQKEPTTQAQQDALEAAKAAGSWSYAGLNSTDRSIQSEREQKQMQGKERKLSPEAESAINQVLGDW